MNRDQHLQQLLGEIAEIAVPDGSLDLTERVRRQAGALPAPPRPERARPRIPLLRPALLGLALLAIVALGLRLMPSLTPSVSAQEALRRAQQANAFGLAGIRSLHGVLETYVPGTGSTVREEIWVEMPGKLRKDIVWPATESSAAELQTDLISGSDAWIWSVPAAAPGTKPDSITKLDPVELSDALYIIPNPLTSLDTDASPAAGLCAQPGDQLALLGEEALFGRDALVIECRIGDADNNAMQAGTRLKLWIDKQLFMVVKSIYYEADGQVFVESHFTQLEIDPALSADRFQLPSGVPVSAPPSEAPSGAKRK